MGAIATGTTPDTAAADNFHSLEIVFAAVESRNGTAAKSTCRQAASAIGPSGQCGARRTSNVSASAAIRRHSEMPPAWETSGWATAMPAWSTGRKSVRL